MSSPLLKILLCETEKGTSEKLEGILDKLQCDVKINESEAEKVKRSIAVFVPDVLLTDHQFWLRCDAVEIIHSLRVTETLPIVVWAKNMNEKILSAIFRVSDIHFIKQSDDISLLTDMLMTTKK